MGWGALHSTCSWWGSTCKAPKFLGRGTPQNNTQKNYENARHTRFSQVLQSVSALDVKQLRPAPRPAAISSFPVHFTCTNIESEKYDHFPFEEILFASLFALRKASLLNSFPLNKSEQGLFTCMRSLLRLSADYTNQTWRDILQMRKILYISILTERLSHTHMAAGFQHQVHIQFKNQLCHLLAV